MSVNTLHPISFSGGAKSISDDDLCSKCRHCDYQPGEMSGCGNDWPGLEDSDGYVQECQQFQKLDDLEYAFDCKLVAALRVKAKSQQEAEEIVRKVLDAASCNAGCWPDGSPVLFEASIDGELSLFEVGGEPAEKPRAPAFKFTHPIIGQEAVCPDGLGRVIAFNDKFPDQWIQIQTYANDRGCKWSPDNVDLIPLARFPAVYMPR